MKSKIDSAFASGFPNNPAGKKTEEEFKNFDYMNTNLNKLDEETLKKHKKNMDTDFVKNRLRPGDPGFKYDSRKEFSYNADEADDNSWDESDEEVGNDVKGARGKGKDQMEADFSGVGLDDDEYFDDDFA